MAASEGDGVEAQREVTLRSLTSSGVETYTGAVTLYTGRTVSNERLPTGFEQTGILAAFPNPFRERTLIEYAAPGQGPVRLLVYDVLGRKVADLSEGRGVPGRQQVEWDGRGTSGEVLPVGLYIVRLETPTVAYTRLITRVK